MHALPFQFVKNELVSSRHIRFVLDWYAGEYQAAGTAKPSLTAAFLEEAYAKSKDQNICEAEEETISHLAGAVFSGGADTVR